MGEDTLTFSECHPEELQYSKGLCQQCYNRQYHSTRNGKPSKCHPAKFNYSRGLCKACYETVRRKTNPQAKKTADEWKKKNPHLVKAQQKRIYRKRQVARYGLTESEYDALHKEQEGKCKLCGKPEEQNSKNKKKLAVDHCHVTNVIRGLLCANCNVGLGLLGDNSERLRKALQYLLTAEQQISEGGTLAEVTNNQTAAGQLP